MEIQRVLPENRRFRDDNEILKKGIVLIFSTARNWQSGSLRIYLRWSLFSDYAVLSRLFAVDTLLGQPELYQNENTAQGNYWSIFLLRITDGWLLCWLRLVSKALFKNQWFGWSSYDAMIRISSGRGDWISIGVLPPSDECGRIMLTLPMVRLIHRFGFAPVSEALK